VCIFIREEISNEENSDINILKSVGRGHAERRVVTRAYAVRGDVSDPRRNALTTVLMACQRSIYTTRALTSRAQSDRKRKTDESVNKGGRE